MSKEYVQERIEELNKAIEIATYAENSEKFNFYRGQLHVWQEVLRSLVVA